MAQKTVEESGKRFEITYEVINPTCERQILFLHGWGSNKEVMKAAFADKFRDFALIFVDMPGFGKSPTEHVLKTADYARIMRNFLDLSSFSPSIIF